MKGVPNFPSREADLLAKTERAPSGLGHLRSVVVSYRLVVGRRRSDAGVTIAVSRHRRTHSGER